MSIGLESNFSCTAMFLNKIFYTVIARCVCTLWIIVQCTLQNILFLDLRFKSITVDLQILCSDPVIPVVFLISAPL